MEDEPLISDEELSVEAEAPVENREFKALKVTDHEKARLIAIAKGEDPDAVGSDAPSADDEQDAEPAQGSAAAEVAEDDDDDAGQPEPQEQAVWYNDRDKAYAEQYGITEFELARLKDRDTLALLCQQIDRVRAIANKPEPKSETPAEGELSPKDANGFTNVEFYRQNGYDEATIALAESTRKQEERMAKFEADRERERADREQYEQQQYVASVHEAIDDLGMDSFFGRSVDDRGNPVQLSEKHLQRRVKLHDEIMALEIGYAQSGRTVPPMKTIVQKAKFLAFGDEIAARDKRGRYEKIAAQSQRRRPVGTSVSAATAMKSTPPENPYSTEAILQQPAMQRFFKDIEEKRGVRL